MEVVGEINKRTADFSGMDVPVKVIADPETKEFEIEVGTPPVSALIKKSLSLRKGSRMAGTETVGDLPLSEVLKIIEAKGDSMLSYDMSGKVKEVLGTCISMGVQVEGTHPRAVQKAIDDGQYREMLSQ
jgi:large subunit ribosomal protein L11